MKILLNEIPAYYINTDGDMNRNVRIKELLNSLKFSSFARVPGFYSGDGPDHHRIGCAKSQISILKQMLDREDFTPFILFEDDIDLRKNFNSLDLLVDIPDDADALYLGLSVSGTGSGSHKSGWFCEPAVAGKYNNLNNIHKVTNMLNAHAILYLSKKYTETVYLAQHLALADSEIVAGDCAVAYYVNKNFNVFALDEPIFYQNDLMDRHFFTQDKSTNVTVDDLVCLDMGEYKPKT